MGEGGGGSSPPALLLDFSSCFREISNPPFLKIGCSIFFSFLFICLACKICIFLWRSVSGLLDLFGEISQPLPPPFKMDFIALITRPSSRVVDHVEGGVLPVGLKK